MDGKLHSTSYREISNLSDIIEYYRSIEHTNKQYHFTDSYTIFRNFVTGEQQKPVKGKEYYPVTVLWGHPGDDIIVGDSHSSFVVTETTDDGVWFGFGFLPTISSVKSIIHTRCFETIEKKNEFIDFSILSLSDKYRHFEIVDLMNMVNHDKER